MCNFELEGSERVYKVALLTFRGWSKAEDGDGWLHPDGKKYLKHFSDNEVSEEDTWPLDEAVDEEAKSQNESFW